LGIGSVGDLLMGSSFLSADVLIAVEGLQSWPLGRSFKSTRDGAAKLAQMPNVCCDFRARQPSIKHERECFQIDQRCQAIGI